MWNSSLFNTLRVIICKHHNQVKMTCLRFTRNFVSFLFMSGDDRKWKIFFSETVRFHDNKIFCFKHNLVISQLKNARFYTSCINNIF